MPEKTSKTTRRENRKNCYLVVDDVNGSVINLYTVTDHSKQKLHEIASRGELGLFYQKGKLIQTLRNYSEYIRKLEAEHEVKVEAVISLSLFKIIANKEDQPYCI